MSFVNKFSLTLLTNIIIVILGVLNNIIVVRAAGASGQGLFTLVITIANTIMIFLGGGAMLETNKYLAKRYGGNLTSLFYNSIAFYLIISTVLFLWWVFFAGYPFGYFVNKGVIAIILLSIPFIIMQEANRGMLWGLEKIDKHNLINIIRSALLLMSNALILIFLHRTITSAIVGWLATLIIGGLVSVWFVVKELKSFSPTFSKDIFLKSTDIGWRTFMLSTIAIISLRADIFLIRFFLDNSAVGYYSVVVLIVTAINISPMISGMIVFNKAVNNSFKGVAETAQLSRICVAYSLLISILLVCFGKYFLGILFGPQFAESYPCLIYSLPSLIAQNLISVIVVFICGMEGFPVFNIVSLITALVINIGANVLLIPKWGINGAAIASSMAIGTRAVMNIFYFKAKTKLPFAEFMVLRKNDLVDLKARLRLSRFRISI